MSTYEGAWRPEEPKEVIPAWDFAAYRKSSPEGPWGGVQDLFPEGKSQLPRSAGGVLKAAQEHGWGFGPISLVMRLNRDDAKPLYVSWIYNVKAATWSFGGAGVKGHHIAKAGEALALVKTEQAPPAGAPDYSRYPVHGDANGDASTWCSEHEAYFSTTNAAELFAWIENHEKEHHGDQD